jgi:hypothetical protein
MLCRNRDIARGPALDRRQRQLRSRNSPLLGFYRISDAERYAALLKALLSLPPIVIAAAEILQSFALLGAAAATTCASKNRAPEATFFRSFADNVRNGSWPCENSEPKRESRISSSLSAADSLSQRKMLATNPLEMRGKGYYSPHSLESPSFHTVRVIRVDLAKPHPCPLYPLRADLQGVSRFFGSGPQAEIISRQS